MRTILPAGEASKVRVIPTELQGKILNKHTSNGLEVKFLDKDLVGNRFVFLACHAVGQQSHHLHIEQVSGFVGLGQVIPCFLVIGKAPEARLAGVQPLGLGERADTAIPDRGRVGG